MNSYVFKMGILYLISKTKYMNKEQALLLIEYCNGLVGKYYKEYYIYGLFIAPRNGEQFNEILNNFIEERIDQNA